MLGYIFISVNISQQAKLCRRISTYNLVVINAWGHSSWLSTDTLLQPAVTHLFTIFEQVNKMNNVY